MHNIEALGSGCKVVDGSYISTVPFELSGDQIFLMKMAEGTGYVDKNVARRFGWTEERYNYSIVSITLFNALEEDAVGGAGLDRPAGGGGHPQVLLPRILILT